MTKKKLPIGISDFKKLIKEGCYFVDKSMLIDELLEKNFEVTLLARPRRFGKTLNMSMIENFFNMEKKEENKNLFDGLAISKTDKMKFQGESPVIFLSFKDIKVGTWELCLEKTADLLEKEYISHGFILEKSRSKLENSLLNLSQALYEKYGKKVIILIDEYDTPLITAYNRGYYNEAMDFFRNFLSAGLKDNEYLDFSVMTGILRISKESIFSGLNNIYVSTILKNSFSHFGLKEDEVEEILKYYELDYKLDDVREWYNGYTFGEEKVYNPWSILNYINEKTLASYWVNTADDSLIRELLKKNDKAIFKELELLFEGNNIWKSVEDTIIFNDLNRMSSLWSLLLFSGYLTIEDSKTFALTEIETYSLKIPNQEVKSFFRKSFIDDYTNGNSELYSYMMNDLFEGNIKAFIENFKELYSSTISYHDTAENEKYYHHFMLGLLLTLGDKYTVTSNRESGYGRYDIALEPKDKKNFGMIFEFKVATEDNLKEKAKEAINQINDKKYDASMKANGVEKVIKIGMAFYKKDVAIEAVID